MRLNVLPTTVPAGSPAMLMVKLLSGEGQLSVSTTALVWLSAKGVSCQVAPLVKERLLTGRLAVPM